MFVSVSITATEPSRDGVYGCARGGIKDDDQRIVVR